MSILLRLIGAPPAATPVEDLPPVLGAPVWESVTYQHAPPEEFAFQVAAAALEQEAPALAIAWTDAGFVFTHADEFVSPHLADEPAPTTLAADAPWFTIQAVGQDVEFSAPHLPEDSPVFFWPAPAEAWVSLPPVDEAAPTQSTPDDAGGPAPAVLWEDAQQPPYAAGDDYAAQAQQPAFGDDGPPLQAPWSDSWVTTAVVDVEFSSPHLADEGAGAQPALWEASHVAPAPAPADEEFSAPHLADDHVPNLPPMWVDAWSVPHVESEVLPGSSIGHADFTPGLFNLFAVPFVPDPSRIFDDKRSGGGVGNFAPYVAKADPRVIYRRLFPRLPGLEAAPLGSAGATALSPSTSRVSAPLLEAAGSSALSAAEHRVVAPALGAAASTNFSPALFAAEAPALRVAAASALTAPTQRVDCPALGAAAASPLRPASGALRAPALASTGAAALAPAVVDQREWLARVAPTPRVQDLELALDDFVVDDLALLLEDFDLPDIKRAA